MTMNLQLLRPSRRRLRAGDVFAMLPSDGLYLFGRVIFDDLPIDRAPMSAANLVYVYRHRSSTKEPDREALDPEDLLLPPLFINRLPWSKGYLETVAHWPLGPGDVRSRHCFLSAGRGVYVDENGDVLAGPIEPVGDWGLHGYDSFDKSISAALGIPADAAGAQGWSSGAGTAGVPDGPATLDSTTEQAVLLHATSLPDNVGLAEVEDLLIEAIESAGVGEFDGNEIGLTGRSCTCTGPTPTSCGTQSSRC